MKTATLRTFKSTPELEAHGTFGEITCECGKFRCYTLELPYRDVDGDGKRDPKKSCVARPAEILFKWRTDSPAHGECYEEWDDPDTPEREDAKDIDNMQIHSANLAGDVQEGYVAQLKGCIAPGEAVVRFRKGSRVGGHELQKDQMGVASSGAATKRLEEHFGGEIFKLKIIQTDKEVPTNA